MKKTVLILLLLIAVVSTTSTATARADSLQAALAHADILFRASEHEAVIEFLQPYRQMAEPPLEVLFILGMSYMQQERHVLAADEFRLMLARDPSLLRPRLELALALQRNGDLQAARYHYEQVLAAELPVGAQRNIYQQLSQIREREPTLRLNLELTSDTNPTQSTSSDVIYIGGLPFIRNDQNQAETVWGVAGSADLHLPLPSNPDWFARLYGSFQDYPGRALDAQYVQASAGRRAQFGAYNLSAEAGAHITYYEHRRQRQGVLVRGTLFTRPSRSLALSGDLEIRSYHYPELGYLDGHQSTATARVIRIATPTQRWDLSFSLSHYDASSKPSSYLQPGINLRYLHEWTGGWITGVRVQGRFSEHEAPDPFFRQTRRDVEGRLELDLLNRRIDWQGFSPQMLFGYTRRESNLTLYSYDRFYARIGLTSEF
ncbi:surface lipoprotein assembly modifier [Nitrincola alkalilacustris]|uniref:surface lipoprotein assembly modifier n=1 Tax=Nitrincola alkalilacustris TaxID=1571224 RepID=UPI00124BFFF1|nr:surface lipoprotein assembly modifier [Nitrincola alkalilacustris]